MWVYEELCYKNRNMNLKIRTVVLEYSLKIESHINTLLLGHLEIFDKEKTKNERKIKMEY